MIEIIEQSIKSADSDAIRMFLADKTPALAYHRVEWQHALQLAYGHQSVYLLAFRDGALAGVLPICIFRGLFGRKSLISLPYCDVGGIVTDDADVADALYMKLAERVAAHGYSGAELRQQKLNSKSEESCRDRKVRMQLALPNDVESLMRGFKAKLRSQIRKAEKNGLQFRCSSDEIGVNSFFEVYSRNMHELGSPSHDKSWFEHLQREFDEDMCIGSVWLDDRCVGAGVMLLSGQTASVPWASTLREYNRLAPNMLLYWNLQRMACERGMQRFDFGRSTFGEGTFRFKKQWGALPVLLDWVVIDSHGRKTADVHVLSSSRGRQAAEYFWQKSPFVIANWLGPRIRKYISL